jgi:hypothetical protein
MGWFELVRDLRDLGREAPAPTHAVARPPASDAKDTRSDMEHTSRNHRARALIGGMALVAGAVFGTAAPASATEGTTSDALVFVPYNGQTFTVWRNGNKVQPVHFSTQQAIEGNFSGTVGTDLFLYNPGSGADGILHVSPSGTTATTAFRSETVNGSFKPLVGDFDGNAIQDIFWYAPGAAPDYVWLFQANGSHTVVNQSVSGTYRPTVSEVSGDGYDDIIWYGVGNAPDSMWLFDAGATHISKSVSIGGDYQLIPGYFGIAAEGQPQKRIVFFNKAGFDYVWTFDSSANHTSLQMGNVDGNFVPLVGNYLSPINDQILFYRAGAGGERLVGFTNAGAEQQYEAPNVNGTYDPAIGDFDGNGYDDIAWGNAGKATLWKFNGGGYTQANIVTNTVNTQTHTTHSELFES